ncbi:hypothetical protein DPEC_G00235730 [Dallia pectoralis]|uniref:Uncharacterized protein n=1 Tax=Dallia pectoralis TaxID=75939 RepID=A0ACC2FYB9_DALPE|nr:hypothetical protein DPEC_G00235730 [Dallia pectoralis]
MAAVDLRKGAEETELDYRVALSASTAGRSILSDICGEGGGTRVTRISQAPPLPPPFLVFIECTSMNIYVSTSLSYTRGDRVLVLLPGPRSVSPFQMFWHLCDGGKAK